MRRVTRPLGRAGEGVRGRESVGMDRTNSPALMTIDAAAEYLSMSRSTLYGMIRDGEIQVVRLKADMPRIRRADLDRMVYGETE